MIENKWIQHNGTEFHGDFFCVLCAEKIFKQMRKYRFYIGLILAALLLTACNKDDEDPTAEVWKQQNEKAFNDLAQNPEFTALKIQGGPNYDIYYRVIHKGEGKPLLYTSRAEVYYKGWFVVTNADKNIKAGDVFDQRLFDDGVPFKVAVNYQVADTNYGSVIEGWRIALQNMVEGDKWEVCIPHQLGYKEAGSGSIPAYSTLGFEIEVVKAIDRNEF